MGAWTGNDIAGILLIGIIMIGVGISVDLPAIKKHFKHPTPLVLGNLNQYVMMPFLCWVLAVIINPPSHVRAAFVIVGTMPGGTISNILSMWLHVDKELSAAVTSTTVLLSLATIPFNLWLYLSVIKFPQPEPLTWGHLNQSTWINVSHTDGTYGAFEPDWVGIAADVGSVIGGLLIGLFLGNVVLKTRFRLAKLIEFLCLCAGIAQGVIGMINSSQSQLPIWKQPPAIYGGMMVLATLSFSVAIFAARFVFKQGKEQSMVLGIESSVQNAAIAISTIMLSIRNFELMGQALAIPIVYSMFSLIVSIVGGLIAWKTGWTSMDPHGPNPCSVWCGEYKRDIQNGKADSDDNSQGSDEENPKKAEVVVTPESN